MYEDKQKIQDLMAKGRFQEALLLTQKLHESNPDDQDVLVLLGLIYGAMKNYRSAESCFRRVVSISPDNPEANLGLADTLAGMRRFADAIGYYRRVLLVKQDLPGLYINYGNCLQRERKTGEAIEAFLNALKLDPRLALAHRNLALLYEGMQKVNDARKHAELAVQCNEDDVESHIVISKLDIRGNRSDLAKERLERLLQKSPKSMSLANILMELGKLLDREGEYANAFDRMTLAKKEIRAWYQIKDQDLAGYRNEIERYKNVFSGLSISSRDDGPFECSPAGIVFLVGFPRSGTTLTEQILGSYPDFIITDELPVLSRIAEDIGSVIGRPFTYPDDVVGLSRNDTRMLRSTYWHRMEESLGGVSLKGKYLLDKLPLNLRHLGLIERLFPEARVLVALRDPRDVCISCYMQAFSLNPAMAQFLTIDDTAEFYATVMGLWLHFRGVLNIKVLETRYEDIVDDLEGAARRILAFVGLEWKPEVMQFYESARKRHIHTPSYESVVQPIYRKSVARWKRYKEQIGPIIPVLEPFLREFGYSDVTYGEE